MKCVRVVLLLVVAAFLMSVSLTVSTETEPFAGGDLAALFAALDEAGFVVQDGEYGFTDAIALCNAGVIQTCQGNNVGAPYLAYKLPPAPGQTIPNPFADERGLSLIYRLRPDEAILQIGYTPPRATYFSYQSYLAFRYDPAQKQMTQMFNSLGDSLNNLTIQTAGGPEDPFAARVILLTVADRGTAAAVTAALIDAGYPTEIINFDVISPSIVHMGLGPQDDLFQFLSRIALPDDPEALQVYLDHPGSVILRLTPKEERVDLEPYSVPTLRVRGTGSTELDLLPAVEELRTAILARYADLEATEIPTVMAYSGEGYTAIQGNVNYLGDTRDAAYFSTVEVLAWTDPTDRRRAAAALLSDDPNDFLIIYGVNHETTGKATYASCTFYGLPYLNGVAGVTSRTYAGSAEDYLPGHPLSGYLYAWKVSRDSAGDPHCLEIPVGPMHYGVALDEPIIVFFRTYLEPSTKVGPALNELVVDRVIHFHPKTGG